MKRLDGTMALIPGVACGQGQAAAICSPTTTHMRHVARDIPPPTGANLVVRGGWSAVLHGVNP
ncbi:hypothetical protein [Streptomyces capitiformicae]|uniref:Uncharacterized protein n=1 Tax=Streptomyces capitiformicae TaxID=2014920 RepID=A0A918ZL88_9ACTN|nr:hypothetical protein [Streptomyces capitiformicae]GHE59024.1 hypothetical protein GCM10017771_82100 [Streptomyces capitiformicae]